MAQKREGTKMFGAPGFSNTLTQRLVLGASRTSKGDQSMLSGDGSCFSLGTMSMLDLEAAQAQTVKILLQNKVNDYKHSVMKAHETDMKKTRHLAMVEAKEFVKFATSDIECAFTKEVRNIIEQFLYFKTRTWTQIDNVRSQEDNLAAAEKIAAQ